MRVCSVHGINISTELEPKNGGKAWKLETSDLESGMCHWPNPISFPYVLSFLEEQNQ